MVHYALVVDDDPSARRLMLLSLIAQDWDVDEASFGDEALERLAKVPTGGVVIVDLELGDELGSELIEAMRHRRGDLRFLLVSATDAELTEIGRSVNATVLHKPIDLDSFPQVAASA